jgi:hypothetical protein
MPHTNALSLPDGTYCLHEYLCFLLRVPVLPLTSTCCLPRPPQLRGQLKEVPELVSLEARGKSTWGYVWRK